MSLAVSVKCHQLQVNGNTKWLISANMLKGDNTLITMMKRKIKQ